jgi:protein-arginine kinase activator protein McsA
MRPGTEYIQFLLNGTQPGMKISDLAKFGTVSEEVTETEDAIVTTRTFRAKDSSLTKAITVVTPKEDEVKTEQRVADFNNEINKAIKEENYELAAKLKEQRDILLQS